METLKTKLAYRLASGFTLVYTVPEFLTMDDVRCMLFKPFLCIPSPNGGSDFVLRTDKIESVSILHVKE